ALINIVKANGFMLSSQQYGGADYVIFELDGKDPEAKFAETADAINLTLKTQQVRGKDGRLVQIDGYIDKSDEGYLTTPGVSIGSVNVQDVFDEIYNNYIQAIPALREKLDEFGYSASDYGNGPFDTENYTAIQVFITFAYGRTAKKDGTALTPTESSELTALLEAAKLSRDSYFGEESIAPERVAYKTYIDEVIIDLSGISHPYPEIPDRDDFVAVKALIDYAESLVSSYPILTVSLNSLKDTLDDYLNLRYTQVMHRAEDMLRRAKETKDTVTADPLGDVEPHRNVGGESVLADTAHDSLMGVIETNEGNVPSNEKDKVDNIYPDTSYQQNGKTVSPFYKQSEFRSEVVSKINGMAEGEEGILIQLDAFWLIDESLMSDPEHARLLRENENGYGLKALNDIFGYVGGDDSVRMLAHALKEKLSLLGQYEVVRGRAPPDKMQIFIKGDN
ncbi:MAG: hypothetical protein Q8R48_05465, partial [Candidatus Omnitrophota bacterium]|nr:hypothetical protein [Candidatus Omnitrophota bacterium]